MAGGASVAHTVGGLVVMAHTTADRAGLVAIVVLTVLAVAVLDRRLRVRGSSTAPGRAAPAPG